MSMRADEAHWSCRGLPAAVPRVFCGPLRVWSRSARNGFQSRINLVTYCHIANTTAVLSKIIKRSQVNRVKT